MVQPFAPEGPGAPRAGVLLAADACGWEASALEAIAAGGRYLTLVKRCLDLTDLLATAATGSADVALVSHRLRGLDADVVERLLVHGVRTVAVLPDPPSPVVAPEEAAAEQDRLLRSGVARVLAAENIAGVA